VTVSKNHLWKIVQGWMKHQQEMQHDGEYASRHPHGVELVRNMLSEANKQANKIGAAHVLFVGAEEVARGVVGCKNMETGVQEAIGFEKFIGTIKSRLKEFS